MKSLKKEVGGNHYKKFVIQPIEFIGKNKLDFMQGNIIKYICRFRDKNGLEDLKKIKHYVDVLIDLEYPEDGISSIEDEKKPKVLKTGNVFCPPLADQVPKKEKLPWKSHPQLLREKEKAIEDEKEKNEIERNNLKIKMTCFMMNKTNQLYNKGRI